MNDTTLSPRPRRRRRAGLAVVALTISVGALSAALGCAGDKDTHQGATPSATSAAPFQLVLRPVVRERSGLRGDSASATLVALRRAAPGTKVMGQVLSAPVEEGQTVRRNQLLAKLESRDLEAAVRQAQAGLAMAEAELVKARANLARTQELHSRGSMTEKNLEDASAYASVTQASLENARANLEAARVRLGYAEIRSPLDGWLTQKNLHVGDMATPGMTAFVVEDLAVLELNAELAQAQLTKVHPGDEVTVEVAERSLAAVVTTIVPSGDPRSRTFTLKARIDNRAGDLRPGMFARIVWNGSSPEAASEGTTPRVPRAALVRRGQLEGVFLASTAADGSPRVALRWVKTGAEQGDEIEVLSGLEGGERVVINPPETLFDGAPYAEGSAQGGSR